MFHAPSPYGSAQARYRDVDIAARVYGASPHGLVSIMFDELLRALDTLHAAESGSVRAQTGAVQARATSILHGLEAALDYQRGGEIAINLGRIYREARRLIASADGGRVEAIDQARRMTADIAGAWAEIG